MNKLNNTQKAILKYLLKHGATQYSTAHDVINDTAALHGLLRARLVTQSNGGMVWAITDLGKAALESHTDTCQFCGGSGQVDTGLIDPDEGYVTEDCSHCNGAGNVTIEAVMLSKRSNLVTFVTRENDDTWDGYGNDFVKWVVWAGGDVRGEMLMLPELSPAPEIGKLEGVPLEGYGFGTADLGSAGLTHVLIDWANVFYEITEDEPPFDWSETDEQESDLRAAKQEQWYAGAI